MTIRWLSDLERKVASAGEEIQLLREKNRTLGAQVKRLKRRLARAGGGDDRATWAAEREELRERVARLAGRLEELL